MNHHQVVGKCNSSEAREFTGENSLGRESLLFSGNVAPGVAEAGSLFPRLQASIWESCRRAAAGCDKRIGTAAQQSMSDAATLMASGIAAGGWAAEATEKLAGRKLRAEVAQISGCPGKK